jgi:hypothetical protein
MKIRIKLKINSKISHFFDRKLHYTPFSKGIRPLQILQSYEINFFLPKKMLRSKDEYNLSLFFCKRK